MRDYALPKKTLLLWQTRVAVLGVLLTAAVFWSLGGFSWSKWILIAVGILLLPIIFVYLPLYFKSYKISVKNGAVVIDRGVFIKTSHIMPFSRLLYAQSISSPIARLFGLSALSLKATRSSLFIPEISRREVEAVMSMLTLEDGR